MAAPSVLRRSCQSHSDLHESQAVGDGDASKDGTAKARFHSVHGFTTNLNRIKNGSAGTLASFPHGVTADLVSPATSPAAAAGAHAAAGANDSESLAQVEQPEKSLEWHKAQAMEAGDAVPDGSAGTQASPAVSVAPPDAVTPAWDAFQKEAVGEVR